MGRIEESQSIAQKILLLLLPHSYDKNDNMVCSRDMTVMGIADRFGLKENHVRIELGRMREKGWIDVGDSHANHVKRRVNVYYLTEKGRHLAMQFKRLAREEPLVPVFDGGLEARNAEGVAANHNEAAAEIGDWEQSGQPQVGPDTGTK